jgi:hypothetical protein
MNIIAEDRAKDTSLSIIFHNFRNIVEKKRALAGPKRCQQIGCENDTLLGRNFGSIVDNSEKNFQPSEEKN